MPQQRLAEALFWRFLRRRHSLAGAACIAGLWFIASAASAQTAGAKVSGRVTDATGGALPGATVSLRRPSAGVD